MNIDERRYEADLETGRAMQNLVADAIDRWPENDDIAHVIGSVAKWSGVMLAHLMEARGVSPALRLQLAGLVQETMLSGAAFSAPDPKDMN